MTDATSKRLAVIFAISLAAITLSAPANAGSLRQGSTSSGAAVTGSLPGEVLWTWYETSDASSSDNHFGNGDNIIRLVNPVGSANVAFTGLGTADACAMIYVFDDDEEMGACCGCPITPTQMATISVEEELTSNFIGGGEGVDTDNGAIAIVAAAPNRLPTGLGDDDGNGCSIRTSGTERGACNNGCDPGRTPGYTVPSAKNLLGSITHNQVVGGARATSGLTEEALFDDGGGDPNNLTYLQTQCSILVGNGSGGGVCNCSANLAPLGSQAFCRSRCALEDSSCPSGLDCWQDPINGEFLCCNARPLQSFVPVVDEHN
jgi:hypothetical protein